MRALWTQWAARRHLVVSGTELPRLDDVERGHVDAARDEAVARLLRDRLQRPLDAVKNVLHDSCTRAAPSLELAVRQRIPQVART